MKHGNIEEKNYSDTFIFVHISGAVNKEDVYEMKENSRILDVIEKAGGLREDAYTEDINLAYKLEDGMKIHIPTKQEKEEEKTKMNILSEGTFSNSYITSSSGLKNIEENNKESNKENKDGLNKNNVVKNKVNINTATQEELESLPGIGKSTALKIIQYRKEKGKFNKIDEIKEVSGIGEAKYEKIKKYITI